MARGESAAWQHLYKTARWRKLREWKLAQDPLCQWCLEEEIVTPATEVHHSLPHKGDLEKFWTGPFVATCKPCHSSRGQIEDRGGKVIRYGADGYPL
ncbi:HNH endonuclease signature motif containing protein [Mesorhizobium sp. WSM3876]|uniref:HNH endonuclease signature motif containing protein n=1 Tax=Mesorhizobium sp. WSM3876 TaxID=422277 RepID=UPI000BAEDF7E|nr:HNH endonuclease signature motif containing protein [Mesorhizobium sp. WSM3876]PBB84577.1 HNH endonuclease [Mesorhizobium sp. WSM3876]